MPLAPTAPKLPRLRAPKGGLVVAGRPYRAGVFLPESARPILEVQARMPTPARVIGILGFSYRVEPVAIDPAIGDVAFSLHDTDRNRLHHVHRATSGEVVCNCGDYEFRRRATGSPCKHGAALLALGLVPAFVAPSSALPADRADDAGSDSSTWPAWTDEPIPFRPARRIEPAPPARRRRFEPSPDDFRQAAEMFNA